MWDEESGVPLMHAVAASCVVPMLFPTVTINGARYMDGGILSHLNATVAPPSDVLRQPGFCGGWVIPRVRGCGG